MISPKPAQKPPPTVVIDPKRSSGKMAMMPDTAPSQDRIRARAYELYERRGREPGQDQRDWLCAEQEILELAK
jgi:Protein of unknown function (DUF2934)